MESRVVVELASDLALRCRSVAEFAILFNESFLAKEARWNS